MGRRRDHDEDSSSDTEGSASGSGDDLAYETDATEVTGDNEDGEPVDSAWLLGDNDHPPEYYLRQLDELDETEYTEQDYSDGSTLLLNRIEEQWRQYCEYIRKDPNSLGTYWKLYRLVYERATGQKINGPMTRGMHKILKKLAKKYKLKKAGKEKPCMYYEDLKEVLRTNLATTEKKFGLANRPNAILGLCYRHITVTLLRDPDGGPHRVLLEFTYEFTKQYLGIKDMNTFLIPETVYDPSLIFSPHVLLEGLIFDDQAFAAPSLTSPEKLSDLYIEPGKNQLRLLLKPKLDDVPIFRRAVKTLHGWKISPNLPLSYSMLYPAMKKIGAIRGFPQITRLYALRYGAGKAFNDNGLSPPSSPQRNISDSLQNLMMDHGDIRTFLKHYLQRRVTVDSRAVYLQQAPQESIMRAACTMSRWIDIEAMMQSRTKLRQRLERSGKGKAVDHPQYQDLSRQISNKKQRLRYALIKEVQQRYDQEQPVKEVERQLAGIKLEVDPKLASYFSDETPPEQKHLIEMLMLAPLGTIYKEEVRRRNNATNAVIAYCGFQEGETDKRQKRPAGLGKPEVISAIDRPVADPAKQALETAMLAVFKEKRPTICFLCLGNEKLLLSKRVFSFSSPTDLGKHFRRKHLS
ncbi:hypothetical protein EJ08DRAFT_673832 [Tothia fuscella]|uniref:Uncharacterized protein n=1 Tax=Tothia fuscella TaxID=1048955 RepID=A0A9P4TS46_9PEZI|nr:hypothetical protein EJ08DRAFT_673832 [Tothia fuscella]